jgi:hypothetical protein
MAKKLVKNTGYDVMALVTPENRGPAAMGYKWFAADRSIVYPATVARIIEAIRAPELPAELIGSSNPDIDPKLSARTHRDRVAAAPARCWDLALRPLSEFKPGSADDHELLLLRAQGLDLARLWFTRALKLAVGGPIGIHYLNETPAQQELLLGVKV